MTKWPGRSGAVVGWKFAQLVLGGLIYGVSAYPFMGERRTQLLNWGAHPLLQIQINIGRVLEKVVLLFHGGFAWVFAGLLLCAIVGAVHLGSRVVQRRTVGRRNG